MNERLSEQHDTHALATTQDGERAVASADVHPVKLGKLSAMRKPMSWLLRSLGALSAITIVLGAIGYFRLSQGPISLQFLVSPIEQSLNRELLDVSVKVRDAVLRRSRRGGVEFRLTNVVLSDAEGVPVALAPLAAIEISGLALMRWQIAASRIDLIGARMLLLQSKDGTLSLQFSKSAAPDAGPADERPAGAGLRQAQSQGQTSGQTPGQVNDDSQTVKAGAIVVPSDVLMDRLNLARTIAEAAKKARRRTNASSFLRALGLRQTTVIFDKQGQRSVWHVPDFDISFRHTKSDSVITSSAMIDTPRGPWKVGLKVEDSEQTKTLSLNGTISNLVPRTLAGTLPQLALLEFFDLPVSGKSSLKLDTGGRIRGAEVSLELGAGALRLPWSGKSALTIDKGTLKFSYDASTGVVDIAHSRIQWGASFLTIAGRITPAPRQGGHDVWKFDIKAIEGSLAGDNPGKAPLVINQMTVTGWITPAIGRVQLGQFYIKVGGAEIAVSADAVDIGGKVRARMEGLVGPMPLDVFNALWPRGLAPDARYYIGEHLKRGTIDGGRFKYSTADGRAAQQSNSGIEKIARSGSLSATLQLSKLALSIYDSGPLLHAPRALLQIVNNSLEVSVPKANIRARKGRNISLNAGVFKVLNLQADTPLGEIEFRTNGRIRDALALARADPFNLIKKNFLPLKQLGGTFSGRLKVRLPLREDLEFEELKIDGAIEIAEGQFKIPDSPIKVSSVAMKINVSPRAVHVSGQMLMNGIVGKLNWQRIFGLPADRQPAMRLSASLDDADRVQLGMEVNHLVTGIIPVDVSVANVGLKDQAIHVSANLTNAELRLKSMAWRKPIGRRAILQFDIGKGSVYPFELQNFKLVGDNVAIDGWLALNSKFKAQEFYFPEFSVNVVTRLELQGTLSKANVWNIKASGATFDGRDFFSSLFDIDTGERAKKFKRKNIPGINLVAKIDNVIGYGDISLRDFTVTLRKRDDEIKFIEAKGKLDGGEPLTVKLDPKKNQKRILWAQTSRAGKAFKMVGFYPNLRKGRATLKVNLDGRGVAETTGQLEVRKFSILGDQVVSEVLQSIDEGRPAIASRRTRRTVRQRFDFDSLSVPFSVGQGQFVISDSSIKGPVIGASMRGKVDFKARRLNLGGTYVPLSGLNSAFCQIPLLGQILTGPRCEGVFGITFAVKGNLSNPEVIVNPLSMLTPGFLRELMALTPLNPTIKKRSSNRKRKKRTAARSSARRKNSRSAKQSDGPEVIDGWSAQATPNSGVDAR